MTHNTIDQPILSSGEAVCRVCKMSLYTPVAALASGVVGLYDDARFPGRALFVVTIEGHVESIDSLTDAASHTVMDDLRLAVRAVRRATGAARVNVASLGNKEAHLHFHLIPRFPATEPLPNEAPWKDPRRNAGLDSQTLKEQVHRLREALLEE